MGETPRSSWVVGRLSAKRALRTGAIWGLVFGGYVGTQAFAYSSSYKTPASRDRLAALFGTNAGLSALVGPAHLINTVGGYTAWKCLAVLAIVGAVWGLLAGTRQLRGEEEAGRWELLLAGRTTRRKATAEAILGLAVGLCAFFAIAALLMIAVGRSSRVAIGPAAATFFALAVIAGAAMFMAIGTLTSQLAPTRRQATMEAAGILGVAYALRLVADSGTGLTWLRWVSPLGWVEELQPLTQPRPLALLPILALTVLAAGASVYLAGVRDLDDGALPERLGSSRRLSGPSSAGALSVRLARAGVVAWWVGIIATALLLGLIAKSAGSALRASPTLTKALAKLGETGSGGRTYLSLAFLIVAVLLALVCAGQVSALRGEESTGRLEHLLVRPVSRASWLGGRVGIATATIVIGGALAGIFAWLGSASQSTGLSPGVVIEAGLNVVPPALCLLGVGVLAFGCWPRGTTVATYTVLAWSLLVELIGGAAGINHYVLDTSLFHQISAAPAVAPDWTSGAALILVALAATGLGTWAFHRRDFAGE